MTRFVLDANILITWLRKKEAFPESFWNTVMAADLLLLPAAVKAELLSIAYQRNWGAQSRDALHALLSKMSLLHTDDAIIARYAELDAYSQNKLNGQPLTMPAHKMGKNDLWIAATAVVANATLATNDKDFDHLEGTYLRLLKP